MFPILLVMILVGLLRSNVTQLMNSKPRLDVKALRETQSLMKSQRLRSSPGPSDILTPEKKEERIIYYKENLMTRYMRESVANATAAGGAGGADPMGNPDQLEGTMDMMKKNMMQIVPQTLIMSWVSFFFSGFVLTKLPFPLTLRFKSMMQSGIDTRDMDVTWVSSISWYFLLLFGLTSIYTLLLADPSHTATDMSAMSSMQMQQQGNPMTQPAEVKKMFKNEGELLELALTQMRMRRGVHSATEGGNSFNENWRFGDGNALVKSLLVKYNTKKLK